MQTSKEASVDEREATSVNESQESSTSDSTSKPRGTDDPRVLHKMHIGQAFLWNAEMLIVDLPKPDSGEIERCERLITRLSELAVDMGLSPTGIEQCFGVSTLTNGQKRFAVFSRVSEGDVPAPKARQELEDLTDVVSRVISGQEPTDLISCSIPDASRLLAEKHAREYVATDEGTRFDITTDLVCGNLRLQAPPKVIDAPPVDETTKEMEVIGYVDALCRSTREIGVRDAKGLQTKAKFDVAKYLEKLCLLLRLRNQCRFSILQTTHVDGLITKELTDVQQLQQDWVGEPPP